MRGGILSVLLVAAFAPAAHATLIDEVPAGLEPRDKQAVAYLSRDAQAWSVIRAALNELAACQLPDERADVSTSPPSAEMLATLSILGLPAVPGDAAQAERILVVAPVRGTRINATRSTPLTRGEALLVTPVEDVRIDVPLTTACLRVLGRRLARDVRRQPAAVARRVRAELAALRRERRQAPSGPQEGVLMNWLHDDGDAIEGTAATLSHVQTTGVTFNLSDGPRSRIVGLVPNGVASVQLTWPRVASATKLFAARTYPSTVVRRAVVQDNHFEVAGPVRQEADAMPAQLTWLDPTGAPQRRVGFDLLTGEPHLLASRE